MIVICIAVLTPPDFAMSASQKNSCIPLPNSLNREAKILSTGTRFCDNLSAEQNVAVLHQF